MQAFATLLAVLYLAQSALAGVYTTNPTASSSGTGGQVLTVNWADDGNTPSVASVGPCSVDIYTGSRTSQFRLQNLAASVDVSKASSISATIDPKIGANGPYYFIRFTSLSLKDTTSPQYNYQAYSARFTLTGMTGTFNATVQTSIDNINATSSSVSASATAKSSSSASAANNIAAVASGSASGSASAANASKTSGALPTLNTLATPALMALVVGMAAYAAL